VHVAESVHPNDRLQELITEQHDPQQVGPAVLLGGARAGAGPDGHLGHRVQEAQPTLPEGEPQDGDHERGAPVSHQVIALQRKGVKRWLGLWTPK
jgi:hypothetical protein